MVARRDWEGRSLLNCLLGFGNCYAQQQPDKIKNQRIHRHTHQCKPLDHSMPIWPNRGTGHNPLKWVKKKSCFFFETDSAHTGPEELHTD